MLRTEATIPSDAAMEPSTIVCGDGNVETTVGFVLLLYPWLKKVVEEPGSCCGRNPCSILVIPNTKVETMINLTNLVTKGNLKVTKSWKKEHIMSLLSFTYASDIDIKVKKVVVDNIYPVCERIFKNKDGVLKHKQHHSNLTCHFEFTTLLM